MSGIMLGEINKLFALRVMRLHEDDIYRLIKACELYKEQTGSEDMWEAYEQIIQKLEIYKEEFCLND